MDTLARMDFVAQLVRQGFLSVVDGHDVINRAAQRPEAFTKVLAAYGLVVEER